MASVPPASPRKTSPKSSPRGVPLKPSVVGPPPPSPPSLGGWKRLNTASHSPRAPSPVLPDELRGTLRGGFSNTHTTTGDSMEASMSLFGSPRAPRAAPEPQKTRVVPRTPKMELDERDRGYQKVRKSYRPHTARVEMGDRGRHPSESSPPSHPAGDMPSKKSPPQPRKSSVTDPSAPPPDVEQQHGTATTTEGHQHPGGGIRKHKYEPVPQHVMDSVEICAKYRAAAMTEGGMAKNTTADVADVDSWPNMTVARLYEDILRVVTEIDTKFNEDVVVRSEYVIKLLTLMASRMKNYKVAFDTCSVEIQRCVAEIVETRNAAESAAKESVAVQEAAKGKVLKTELACSRQLQTSKIFVDECDGRLQRVKREADVAYIDKVTAERHSREAEHLVEALQKDIEEKQRMVVQFAIRNKELSDRLPVAEAELQEQIIRAEKASLKAQSLTKRVKDMENKMEQEQNDSRRTIDALDKGNKMLQTQLSDLDANYKQVRVLLRSTQDELYALRREHETTVTEHAEEVRVMTPRPTFDDRDLQFFGTLTATANRVDALSSKLLIADQHIEILAKEKADYMKFFVFFKYVLEPALAVPAPPRSASLEVFPVATIESRRLPLFLRAHPSMPVKCKSMNFKEAIYRMRSLMDVHISNSAGGSKALSLSMTMLATLIDKTPVDSAEKVAVGHREKEGAPPWAMPVTELCYSIFNAANTWAHLPVASVFLCILREEVGPWVWAHQNRTIISFMREVVQLGSATIGEYLERIAEVSTAQGFGPAMIAALQEHFTRSFDEDVPIPKPQKKKLSLVPSTGVGSSPSPSRRGTMMKGNHPLQKPDHDPSSPLAGPKNSFSGGFLLGLSVVDSLSGEASEDATTLLGGSASSKTGGVGGTAAADALKPARSASPLGQRAHSPGLGSPNRNRLNMTVKLEFDEGRNNPSSATTLVETALVNALRFTHLHRQVQFNAAVDSYLIAVLAPRRAGSGASADKCTGEERVTKSVAIAAVASVNPNTVDHGTITAYVDQVFEACAAQSRAERNLETEGLVERINTADGFTRAAGTGLPAMQRMFLAGFTDAFHGPLVPYPTLELFNVGSEVAPLPQYDRKFGPSRINAGKGAASKQQATLKALAGSTAGSTSGTPSESDLTADTRSVTSFQLDVKAPSGVFPARGGGGGGKGGPVRSPVGPSPSVSPAPLSLSTAGGLGRGATPGTAALQPSSSSAVRLQLFLRMYRYIPFVPAGA